MMEIIPAIDIIGGKAIRLTKGNYLEKKVYSDDPLAVAQSFFDTGFKRLHLVDLDGAKDGAIRNLGILESITANTSLQVDFGGGVRTKEDVVSVLNAGAWKCTAGSITVKQPGEFSEWLRRFGADKFFIGADILNGTIRVSGWTEDSRLSVAAFLKRMISLGIKDYFCTDISKDGNMQGPATDLYKKINTEFSGIHLFASGGVTTLDDIRELESAGCKGVIIGKAIYEGLISLKELSQLQLSC